MTRILLGFNCNCFTNRYDEPSEWTRLAADLGVRHVMFNIDLIDPGWPWDLQRRLCDETLRWCDHYGITIQCSFGGHHHHQHYLGHPDKECRKLGEEYFRLAMRQTAYLKGRSYGTCFAIQTVRTNNDPKLRSEIIEYGVDAYKRLAEYGAELGLEALAYEMTSVPRETCATFEENDYVLERLKDAAIPMRVCLDMGHRNVAGTSEEADHLAWIRRYGSRCDVIDCQQTDMKASRHWPFTPEFNEIGVIRPDEVIRAIEDSGAKQMMLAFESRGAAFHPQEHRYVDELRQSVEYWRKWIVE